MDIQTYENNYRIRNHWHFIQSQSNNHKISPNQQRKARSNASSREEPSPKSSKSKQPGRKVIEVETQRRDELIRDQYKKSQAKEFVSRVKKEKEQSNGKYFLLKKSNNSQRRSKEEEDNHREESKEVLPKKQRKLSPIMQYKLQQKVKRVKVQNLSKSTMPNSQAKQKIAKPTTKPSRKVHSFSISSPKAAQSQEMLRPSKKLPKNPQVNFSSKPKIPHKHATNPDPSISMQKWFYLNHQDQKTIDSIYLKLQHLSELSNPNPTTKKQKPHKRHRIKTVLS